MRDRTQHRQRGMTTAGLLIMVSFVGLFVYAGIRLLPVYLEYFNVIKSIEGMKSDLEQGPPAMRNSLEKRFDIEDIKSINYKEVEITKEGGGYVAHASYDAQTSFIGNIGFVVHFEKTVVLSGSAGP